MTKTNILKLAIRAADLFMQIMQLIVDWLDNEQPDQEPESAE